MTTSVIIFYSFFLFLNVGTSKDIKTILTFGSLSEVKILPVSFVCKVPEQFMGLQFSYIQFIFFCLVPFSLEKQEVMIRMLQIIKLKKDSGFISCFILFGVNHVVFLSC